MESPQDILNRIFEEYDTCETEQAPSGEWAEYNIEFLQRQAAWFAVEEFADAIGHCDDCVWCNSMGGCDLMDIDGMTYCSKFARKEGE